MTQFANVLTERSMIRLEVMEHDGALWLVTGWATHKHRPIKRPIRLVKMTGLEFETLDAGQMGADFLLNKPIPRAVLDGAASAEEAAAKGFTVLDTPEIEVEIRQAH
jgi:hypothetical protein